MAHVLIVDDDEAVATMLALALTSFGHTTTVVLDGPAALATLQTSSVDIVVLDVMMPGMDGFAICRAIREQHLVPVIMLTARTDPTDIVVGLECGADDYVGKPVEPRVLDARIKALLRRTTYDDAPPTTTLGDLIINEAAATLTRDGTPITLTATEFRLLCCLIDNAGIVMSRTQLLNQVWDYSFDGDSRIVDATIGRLRAKIEPNPAQPAYIHTVRGLGYRLDKS